jgi:hypothetical protein
MNGIRLQTADTDKRAVQLDQFPSAIIESIQGSKTFTPDQQGDASGGAVNMVLKGIPDETILKFTTQIGYNTQTDDDFLTYKGGGVNFWPGYATFKRKTWVRIGMAPWVSVPEKRHGTINGRWLPGESMRSTMDSRLEAFPVSSTNRAVPISTTGSMTSIGLFGPAPRCRRSMPRDRLPLAISSLRCMT